MPNIAKILKEEISRISRHEAKIAVTPIRKPSIKLRKDVANLKTRLALLERTTEELQAVVAKIQAAQPAPAPEAGDKGWISGKGVKSLRRKLGLSQKELARLVGVSANAVVLWENKPGMLKMRETTKAVVFAVRGIGKSEARKRLDEMGKKAPKAVKVTKKAERQRK